MLIQTSTNLYNFSKYVVGGGSSYTSIQTAVNAANAAGGGSVVIRQGAYVEDITLYDGIQLIGADDGITITGTHIPPNAGEISILNLTFVTATDVFSSAAAGTCNIILNNVNTIVANGYLFNLANWTGTLSCNDCSITGIQNGFCFNTASATVVVSNSTIGAGSVNPANLTGITNFSGSTINCPMQLDSICNFLFKSSSINNATTVLITATGTFVNTLISTGIAIPITQSSANPIILSDVTINSSAVNVIAGVGAGAVQLGSVTYLDSSGIAGTITKDFTTRLETGVLKLNDATVGVLLSTAGVVSATTPLGVTNGGTGLAVAAVGDILYGSAIDTFSELAFVNTATRYLANTGGGATIPAWAQIDLSNGVTGTLSEGNGGLGVTNPTDHAVLVGSGAAAVTPIGVGATGELLTGVTGADPAFATSSNGNFTFTSATATVQRTLTISNTDNTAVASPANLQVTVGGATNTGDPFVNFLVTGAGTYSIGIDNSDSDLLKITTGATPSAGSTLMTIANSGNIYVNLGDFYVQREFIGGIVENIISNTDNTNAASDAGLHVLTGGAIGGDPYVNFLVTGAGTYSLGIDNSDSDKLKLTTGATPSAGTTLLDILTTGDITIYAGDLAVNKPTNASFTQIGVFNTKNTNATDSARFVCSTYDTRGDTYLFFSPHVGAATTSFEIGQTQGNLFKLNYATNSADSNMSGNTIIQATTTGEVTMPLQPAFLAYQSGDADNVTGDGTSYTIIFDTEVYDQNADYNNGTGIFTAPVTGQYHFSANLDNMQLGAAHTSGYIGFITSNRGIYGFNANAYVVAVPGGQWIINSSTYSDMDAGDTCYVVSNVSGSTKTVRVHGSADCITSFGGVLVC